MKVTGVDRAREILADVLTNASFDLDSARCALEDGAYLSSAGYTDEDQEAIELAHDALKCERGSLDLVTWSEGCMADRAESYTDEEIIRAWVSHKI